MPDGGIVIRGVWTAERVALLERLYAHEGMPLDLILWRLNDLPGAPVSGESAIIARAAKDGLRRPLAPPPAPVEPPKVADKPIVLCAIARELLRQSRGKLTPAEAVRAAAAERARFASRGKR